MKKFKNTKIVNYFNSHKLINQYKHMWKLFSNYQKINEKNLFLPQNFLDIMFVKTEMIRWVVVIKIFTLILQLHSIFKIFI